MVVFSLAHSTRSTVDVLYFFWDTKYVRVAVEEDISQVFLSFLSMIFCVMVKHLFY